MCIFVSLKFEKQKKITLDPHANPSPSLLTCDPHFSNALAARDLHFNIFMNDLTYAIQECNLVNYIDDTKIYLSHQDPQVVEVGVKKDIDMVSGEWHVSKPRKIPSTAARQDRL